MKLLETIKKLSEKSPLTKGDEVMSERVSKLAQTRGINLQGAYNIELRDLTNYTPSNPILPRVQTPNGYSAAREEQPILSKALYLQNLAVHTKAPYFDFSNVGWKAIGTSLDGDAQVKGADLTPHRLCANVTLSKSLLRATDENMENYIKNLLCRAIYDKLVQTILSDGAETEDCPKGIFNGISAQTISTYNDLCEFQYSGDINKVDNTFILSPLAKQKINKLSTNGTLISNGQLLNSEVICENLMQDGYICYMPLNLLAIAEFGVASITVDGITKATDNEVVIYIDCYFDFAHLNSDFVKVGRFED